MLEEFTKYCERFGQASEIKFKYDHSIRVMNLSVEIGKSLKLDSGKLEIVRLIGLLHDYSRFEQWDKFNTYSDLKSFDHADRAVELLFDNKEIENYNLDKKYYQIVYDAIKYHNKYEIGNVDNDSLLYCQIIRDADKLDILEEFAAILSLDDSEVSNTIKDKTKETFFNHKTIQKIKDGSNYDNIVMKLALIYDLNFEYSFKYIKTNKIIDKMQKQIDMKVFRKYIDEIRKYMEEKIC